MKLSQFRVTGFAASAVYILFGLALLFWPTLSVTVVVYALAGVLTLAGVAGIVAYFRSEPYKAMMGFSLTLGLIALAGGLALFAFPNIPAFFFPFLWGAALLAGGFGKIQMALDMKRMEVVKWWLLLIGALVSIVLGLIAISNPFGVAIALTQFIGASLLVEGIMDALSDAIFAKRRRAYFKDE